MSELSLKSGLTIVLRVTEKFAAWSPFFKWTHKNKDCQVMMMFSNNLFVDVPYGTGLWQHNDSQTIREEPWLNYVHNEVGTRGWCS